MIRTFIQSYVLFLNQIGRCEKSIEKFGLAIYKDKSRLISFEFPLRAPVILIFQDSPKYRRT